MSVKADEFALERWLLVIAIRREREMAKKRSASERAARRKVEFKIPPEFKNEFWPEDIAWTRNR